MDEYLRSALAPAADEHHLGALISLHRQERPLIRFRVRWLGFLLGGLFTGLMFVLWNEQWRDPSSGAEYEWYPDGVFLASVLALLALVLVLGPAIAARTMPPSGPVRWVALYENGLIDVVEPVSGGRAHAPKLTVIRFDDIRHVNQRRESVGSTGRVVTAQAPVARMEVDREGGPVVVQFVGFRRQDRFVDVARTRLAGEPTIRSQAALRRTGRLTFGSLSITKKGMSVTSGVGLKPSESPTLQWSDVVRVNERDDGTLTIYRHLRPDEHSTTGDASLPWFSAVVPNASEAAALITQFRNKSLV
jgi:hypothetical protein